MFGFFWSFRFSFCGLGFSCWGLGFGFPTAATSEQHWSAGEVACGLLF